MTFPKPKSSLKNIRNQMFIAKMKETHGEVREWVLNQEGDFHCNFGPAVFYIDGHYEWFVKNELVTDEVEQWIKTIGLPIWENWTMEHVTLFKLKFG